MLTGLHKYVLTAFAVAGVVISNPVAAQQPREIVFGLPSKTLISSVPRLADEMGLFAKHGLSPKFPIIELTAATAAALISKSAEFSVTGTSEVIAANARGQNLVIVANHYNGLAGSLVLSKALVDKLNVKADAPVAERLKALDNVLLASVSAVSSFTIAYKSAAAANGATPRFTYMQTSVMGAALESGAVQGIITNSPFWTVPVLKGTGVLWISPAKGELPAQFMPSAAAITAVTKAYADANPDTVKRVAAVFEDLSKAFAERPAEVKAAIGRMYPELDANTLDLVFTMEAKAYQTKPLTAKNIADDIQYMKASGTDFGPIDRVDPAATLLKQ